MSNPVAIYCKDCKYWEPEPDDYDEPSIGKCKSKSSNFSGWYSDGFKGASAEILCKAEFGCIEGELI